MKKTLMALMTFSLLIFLSACQTSSSLGFLGGSSDQSISQEAQRALYLNEDPVIANLRAQSIDGVVVLTGYVKKISQSDDAEMIVRQVRGVKGIKNSIIVRQ